ncbi:MAG: ROK family protein [Candidatus Anstonellaceae archaeon]
MKKIKTNKKVLGIDIGGTKIEWSDDSYLFFQKSHKIEIKKNISKKQLVEIIKSIIQKYPDVKKIGISVAGFIKDNKIEKIPNLKKIKGLKIKIKNKTIKIENDLKCAAIAHLYKHLKEKKNIKNFVVVGAGSGIGSAIVINKKIYRGENNRAGEIGHQIIQNTEFEKLSAGQNIKSTFGQRYKKMAKYFGIGLANLVNAVDPKVIYICGSIGFAYLKNKKAKKIFISNLKKYSLNKKIIIKKSPYKNPSLAGACLLYDSEKFFYL